MEFFTKMDKRPDGSIVSFMPAWYNETQIDTLREDIGVLTRRIDRGEIPDSEIPQARAEREKLQRRLDDIIKYRPEPNDRERNSLWKVYKFLSAAIQDSMFSYDEMQMGLANPHEEARRMKQPIIEVDEHVNDLAKSCGVNVQDGKISRDAASKIFKICGKLLHEPTNIENLRTINRRQRMSSMTEREQEVAAVDDSVLTMRKAAGRKKKK